MYRNDRLQASWQGTGSAENRGQDRDAQQQPNTHLTEQQRQDIGSQLGSDQGRVADLGELGGLSGREVASGGSGNRMENGSSGERTDR